MVRKLTEEEEVMFKVAREEQIKMANDHMDKMPTAQEIEDALNRILAEEE